MTELGAEKIGRGEYKYFSPEIIRDEVDDETGEEIKNLLIGGAFTNRPYFKGMQSLQATEVSNSNEDTTFYFFDTFNPMDELKKLLQALLDKETLEDNDMSTAEAEYVAKDGKADAQCAEMFASVVGKMDAQKAAKAQAEADAQAAADANAKKDPTKEGQDQTFSFTDPVTGEKKSVSFAEYTAMQEKLEAYAFAEKQKTVSDKLSGLVFSEENKMSVVLPKSVDKMTAFAMSLSDQQFAQFCEIVKGFNTEAGKLFNEEGGEGDGAGTSAGSTRAEKVEAKAQELMKSNSSMKYREAILEANKCFAEEDGEDDKVV